MKSRLCDFSKTPSPLQRVLQSKIVEDTTNPPLFIYCHNNYSSQDLVTCKSKM